MGSPALGPRRKVLFVEDESTLRRTYKRFFAERYHLAFAASGTEARRQMDEFHPEVLVKLVHLAASLGPAGGWTSFTPKCWCSICDCPTPTVSRCCKRSAS